MPDSVTPADPVTDLGAAAATLHELYLTFVRAGFTTDQVMQLVTASFVEHTRTAIARLNTDTPER